MGAIFGHNPSSDSFLRYNVKTFYYFCNLLRKDQEQMDTELEHKINVNFHSVNSSIKGNIKPLKELSLAQY